MGLISILSKFSPSIGALVLDATITESHGFSAEVTDYPVEKGSNISENRNILPRVLTIDGVISSAPTSLVQISGPNAPLSVPDGFRSLEDLFDSDDLISVVTKLKTYESMLITSLTVPRSSEQGEAVFFSMELRQIRFVNTQRVDVATPLEPAKAAPKQKQGAKQTKEAPDLSQDDRSVLEQIVDSALPKR